MADHMTAEQLRAEVQRFEQYARENSDSWQHSGTKTSALVSIANSLGQLAARLSGMAAEEPELEPSTTTQFVLEMACGKYARHGYAPISKLGTEPDARAKLDAIIARHPDEEWRIMRIDETKTIVYATPEPPHV